MWRAVGILLLLSAALAAALTLWTNHTTASAHARSRAFVQSAKTICRAAPHTVAGVRSAAARIAALDEPPNVHRAVARLELAWRTGAEPKQVRLAAHLLGIAACETVVPR